MTTTAQETATTRRLSMLEQNPNVYKALIALQLASSEGLEPELIELIKIRASQLNGCAYCLRMHVADGLAMGIDPMVIGLIPVWHEAFNHFDERQRSALELTEYVTRIGEEGVPDDAFERARAVFDEVELGQVVASIVMINAWNRVAITSKYPYEADERK